MPRIPGPHAGGLAESERWMERAAELGDANAMFQVAMTHLSRAREQAKVSVGPRPEPTLRAVLLFLAGLRIPWRGCWY
eukprot:COSAG01_NODE_11180_length_1989_cov_1.563492_4_plen_78_part_00